MSDARDHSHSGPEPGESGWPEPGDAGPEARRFWGEYARRTRPGGQREQRDPGNEDGNGGARPAHSHECLDWCPVCRSADVLRSSASPELRSQVQNLQRDALVTLRALLDAYIERVGEPPARRGSAVEDIPIE